MSKSFLDKVKSHARVRRARCRGSPRPRASTRWIARLLRRAAAAGRATRCSSDRATTPPPSARRRRPLLLTTDALVEGVHFRARLAVAARRSAGARLRVNASDVAAMGGRPRRRAASPSRRRARLAAAVLDGDRRGLRRRRAPRTARRWSAATCRAGRRLAITVDAARRAPGARRSTRAGARPGDDVVGDRRRSAATGMRRARRCSPAGASRRPPVPDRVARGVGCSRRSAHAMIDVSDGLVQDLGHVVPRERRGAPSSTSTRMPVARGVPARARRGRGPFAAHGGRGLRAALHGVRRAPRRRSRAWRRGSAAGLTRIGDRRAAVPARHACSTRAGAPLRAPAGGLRPLPLSALAAPRHAG